jgi:Bacterial Ig-like domain
MVCFNARSQRLAFGIGALALLTGCSGDATAPGSQLSELPTFTSAPTSRGVVYVSLSPGKAAQSYLSATVRNARGGVPVSANMTAGGFDPIAVAATTGDTLVTTLRTDAADSVVGYAIVPSLSNPHVVRTVPSDGDTAVSVTAPMTAIFSEPMDSASLAGGVHALNGDRGVVIGATFIPVPGCDDGVCVALDPSGGLDGNSSYQLSINASVRSRAGVPLDEAWVAHFSTGTGLPLSTLVVDRFRVIEYHVPSDSVNWYYAPQAEVSASAGQGDGDVAVVAFWLDLSGQAEQSPPQVACHSIPVPTGQTVELFGERNGDFEFSLSWPGWRAPSGEASGIVYYVDHSGSEKVMRVEGPIVAGTPPSTNTYHVETWAPYC